MHHTTVTPDLLVTLRRAFRDRARAVGLSLQTGHAIEAIARGFSAASQSALLARGVAELRFMDFRPNKAAARAAGLSTLPPRKLAAALDDALSEVLGDARLKMERERRGHGAPIRLCYPGRMLGLSKHQYLEQHPVNQVVFNAVLATRAAGSVWHGDLDLTLDGDDVAELACDFGCELFVLRELDGMSPLALPLERAVAVFGEGRA